MVWPATLPTLHWHRLEQPTHPKPEDGHPMPTGDQFVARARAFVLTSFGALPAGVDLVLRDVDDYSDASQGGTQRSLCFCLAWQGLRTEKAIVVYQDGATVSLGHADLGEFSPSDDRGALLSPQTIRSKVAEVLQAIGQDPSRAKEVPLQLEYISTYTRTNSWPLRPVWVLGSGPFFVDARTGEPGRNG